MVRNVDLPSPMAMSYPQGRDRKNKTAEMRMSFL